MKMLLAGMALVLGCASCGGDSADSVNTSGAAAEQLQNAPAARLDWPVHGGTTNEQRFSPLDQINRSTIANLKPAWYVEYDTTRGQEATPIVIDGVLYTTTAWSKVYAVNAKTGEQLWYYDPKVPGIAGYKACCDVNSRGLAVAEIGRAHV